MNVTPVTPNFLQLTRFGLVNCYLVREHGRDGEPDSFTLVDTGLTGSADDILAAARTAGAPIRRIVLTHAHGDHVGSVDALMQKLSGENGAPALAATARSVPLLIQPPDKSLQEGEPRGKIKGSLPGIRSALTHTLVEGELYGSLRVIETPGHIPGHISLLDERDGTLFAGDALVTVGSLTISGYAPWTFPLPNFATWNKDVAIASVRRLLNYPIERYASGHGVVRGGGVAALREAILKAES